MQKFQALIFDLDGTAMPVELNALPSKNVINAVKDAQKKLKVSAATGRPITVCRNILKALNLDDPCVISGGTQIIDPKTEKTLWEKRLTQSQVEEIVEVAIPYPFEVLFSEEVYKHGASAQNKKITGSERVVYFMDVEPTYADTVLEKLKKIKNIAAHQVSSWNPTCVDIHITHAKATKQHAIELLLTDILKVDKEFVIGVGDSNNDLPLFASVGFKVAMGNATDELKNAADFVAPSVQEDGLATIIKSRILNI